MKNQSNYLLSSSLGVSHFLTDALAAFVLTTITLSISKEVSSPMGYLSLDAVSYFLVYNFFAFFMQIFLGIFFDTFKENAKFFKVSKHIVVVSFALYIVGVFLLQYHFLASVVLTGIGSCLFHLGSGNIALVSQTRKATHLGIFASGGVIGLSFGGFVAVFFPWVVFVIIGLVSMLGVYISLEESYVIEHHESVEKLEKSLKDIVPFIVVGLGIILIARSAIWTHFQEIFGGNRYILVCLAISAFFGKILGGFLEDMPKFKEKYLALFGVLALCSLAIYSYISENVLFLFVGILGIQLFLSPATYLLYTYMKQRKSTIIGFTFGCSLVLGYLVLRG